jgi:hypothetical protein
VRLTSGFALAKASALLDEIRAVPVPDADQPENDEAEV